MPTDTRVSPASRVSRMAGALVGSEILRIAADVRALVAEGRDICNLTVGDFAPSEFRIPAQLERNIVDALRRGDTNYPPSDGVPALREAVRVFYGRALGFTPELGSVIVTCGSRPGIYATYETLVDPGDAVVYPTPSWNNNHYVTLSGAAARPVRCGADTDFLPTRALLEPHVHDARLLALCSPQNPTGTAFTAEQLGAICDLVLEENERRGTRERPLYLMYDQVYWMLTFDGVEHVHPIGVRPAVEPYVVYVDGISKSLAATGVRVGWIVAPPDIAARMSGLLGHVGAWAPKAEQTAVAQFLCDEEALHAYNTQIIAGVRTRLTALHDALSAMQRDGLPVEVTHPEGAIYLSARFMLPGMSHDEVRLHLLHEAGMAVVPFHAFAVEEETDWFRLSVGAVSLEQIERMVPRLRAALAAR